MYPTYGSLAVTLHCNSRCVHCDIWKNEYEEAAPLSLYEKLPDSLRTIDITGGEPFLRPDLPDVVRTIKKSCPHASLLITTHGYFNDRIEALLPELLAIDRNLAFRVSLDGTEETHNRIRRLPDFFGHAMKTLDVLQRGKVTNLGVIFTMMEKNRGELDGVIQLATEKNLKLTVNVVHDSAIYYGVNKRELRPELQESVRDLEKVVSFYRRRRSIMDLGKAWFYNSQISYLQNGVRPLQCDAGERSFFLDSRGNMFTCLFKGWKLGNLNEQSFEEIWQGAERASHRPKVQKCNDCWLTCSAKEVIKSRKLKLLLDISKVLLKG